MANEQNLIPFRSENEAREKGRNGGIKSGQKRRQKRDFAYCANLFLNQKVTNEDIKQQLADLGVKSKDQINMMAIVGAMFNAAMAGDSKAAKLITEWTATQSAVATEEAENDPLTLALDSLEGDENE